MTTPKTLFRRIPADVVKLVEDEQRPRETFGQALKRVIDELKSQRRSGPGSRPTSKAS